MSPWALLPVMLVFASNASAQSDPNVWDYAKSCFERLHLDPADLAGPFDCESANAKRLVSTVDGQVMDLDKCSGSGCATSIPSHCDYGTWLDDGCYGHSWIQVLPTPSNPKVKAALLCRHKTRWSAAGSPIFGDMEGTTMVAGFDDVAMIVHNAGNGETCWFQSDDGSDVHLDGLSVPGPAKVRDHDFWVRPTDARDVMCVKCHDSGPWMNSRWMYNATQGLLNGDDTSPYKNSEPPFDNWPQPHFVELADDDTCTSCHHIAAAQPGVGGTIGAPDFHTCDKWIERATGRAHPKATAAGSGFDVTHWMPLGHGLSDATAWQAQYGANVKALVDCCQAVGTKPQSQWPAGCQEKLPTRTCPVAEAADGSCPVPIP